MYIVALCASVLHTQKHFGAIAMESDSPATVVVDPSSVSMEVAPHLDETANNESSTTALPVATTEEVEASNNNSGEPNADNDNDGDDATGDKATQDKAGGKKSRKRKKHIYNSIRETMEFYFSDANLSKDRFLMKLINENAGMFFCGWYFCKCNQ